VIRRIKDLCKYCMIVLTYRKVVECFLTRCLHFTAGCTTSWVNYANEPSKAALEQGSCVDSKRYGAFDRNLKNILIKLFILLPLIAYDLKGWQKLDLLYSNQLLIYLFTVIYGYSKRFVQPVMQPVVQRAVKCIRTLNQICQWAFVSGDLHEWSTVFVLRSAILYHVVYNRSYQNAILVLINYSTIATEHERRPSNQQKTTYQCKCVHRINYCRYILGLLFTMGPPVVMCPDICWLKKVKVAHTRLPSVGFRSWSRFLAVNLQVTWVINPAVGCHYFLPGLRLPSQPLRGLLPILLLGEQRHNGCEQFA